MMKQDTKDGWDMPVFNGTLQKIQLISNTLSYGPIPEPEEEIEQHLTILANGQVFLSRYCYGQPDEGHKLIEKVSYKVSEESVNNIFVAISEYFGNEHDNCFVTDIGNWNVKLTDSEGISFEEKGSLLGIKSPKDGNLSDLIRKNLNRNDLFAFDGNHKFK